MAFDDLTAACIREVAELEGRLEHTRQWYGSRLERLAQWAREELPEPLKVRFFNIYANGTADHMESPTISQQYHLMKHRAEKAEAELVRLRASGVTEAPAPSAAVRVCTITDTECPRQCYSGPCKLERSLAEHAANPKPRVRTHGVVAVHHESHTPSDAPDSQDREKA